MVSGPAECSESNQEADWPLIHLHISKKTVPNFRKNNYTAFYEKVQLNYLFRDYNYIALVNLPVI